MRNDIDYYRKFSFKEYSVNAKKFREYCDLTRKSENFNEKKILDFIHVFFFIVVALN